MPFLVDSVTAELTRHGHDIHLVVHPQVVVRRDVVGDLHEVCDATLPQEMAGEADARVVDAHRDRPADRASWRTRSSTADLQRVLRDVREAVEDWPKMRDTAVRIADELAERPPVGVPEQEVTEATELLRWLASDHFTFLGYREYVLGPRHRRG